MLNCSLSCELKNTCNDITCQLSKIKKCVKIGTIKAVSIIANGSIVHAEVVTLSGDKKVIVSMGSIIGTVTLNHIN